MSGVEGSSTPLNVTNFTFETVSFYALASGHNRIDLFYLDIR